MSSQQTTPKSNFMAAFAVTGLVSAAILIVCSIVLGWTGTLLTNLPVIFWILYALFIVAIFIIYFVLSNTSTNTSDTKPTKSDPLRTITSIGNGIFLTVMGIIQPEWNATKLLTLTVSVIYILTWGPKLLRYIRTRLNPSKTLNNN